MMHVVVGRSAGDNVCLVPEKPNTPSQCRRHTHVIKKKHSTHLSYTPNKKKTSENQSLINTHLILLSPTITTIQRPLHRTIHTTRRIPPRIIKESSPALGS